MDTFDHIQPRDDMQSPPPAAEENPSPVIPDGVPFDPVVQLQEELMSPEFLPQSEYVPVEEAQPMYVSAEEAQPVYVPVEEAQSEFITEVHPVSRTEYGCDVSPAPDTEYGCGTAPVQESAPYSQQGYSHTPQPEQHPTRRRRESPYANSPYVMQHQQEYRYQPQSQPPEKPEKPKKEAAPRKLMGSRILAALLILALVAGSCLITAYSVNSYWEVRMDETERYLMDKINGMQEQIDNMTPSGGGAITQAPVVSGDLLTPSQIYAQCVNSVVAVSSTVQATGAYGTTEGISTGSGFILTEDGYIVTNYHVVENATAIEVVTHDGTEYPAKLVGYDSANDLAVLKVEATGLAAATLGNSGDLVIGDMVVAIGNPLGELTATQTVGYVSGINREVSTDNTIISMIQTDAAINPGNSGGPLFNAYGQVIGITTAKYSGITGSGASIEGIGFAIPIDDVKSGISDLIDYGYVTGAYLGVTVQNTDPEAAAQFGLPVGATVISVTPGYSADRAGIQVNDIIIGIGDYEVSSITELTRALRNFKAGDITTITVIRGGSRLTLEITLDEKPRDTGTPVPFPEDDPAMPSEGDPEEWYRYFFGE